VFTAQRETRFVFFIEVRHAGIQVPAEIVELRLRGKRAHLFGRFLRDVNKADHDIRNLHAGIVDVVLHLDAPPGATKQAHERVAQRRVAQVADVRSLVWIDICVSTMYLAAPGRATGGVAAAPATAAAKNAARERYRLT